MSKFKSIVLRFGVAFLSGGLGTAGIVYMAMPATTSVSDLQKNLVILVVAFLFGGLFGAEKAYQHDNPIEAAILTPVIDKAINNAQTVVDTRLSIPTPVTAPAAAPTVTVQEETISPSPVTPPTQPTV